MDKKHAILDKYFPECSLTPISGGFTNEVFLLENQDKSFVVKTSHDNNESESTKILAKLKSNFIPKFITAFESDNIFYSVSEYIPNTKNLFEEMNKLDLEKLQTLFFFCGESIAKLHRFTIDATASMEQIPSINSNIDRISIDRTLAVQNYLLHTEQLLKEITSYSMCHGDYGPQQVIFSENSNYIIDWESLCYTLPLYDIGWFSWITYLHIDDQSVVIQVLKSFKQGYSSISSWDFTPKDIKSFAIRKIWEVLPRFVNQNLDISNAWIDRLDKALNTNFDY